MTGSGTCIEVIDQARWSPSVNVSPDAQSTPKSATMSPAEASVMSSISSECMRTRRPTFTFFWVRML
jgi:hypothetical protein